jgi:hypothetical protein
MSKFHDRTSLISATLGMSLMLASSPALAQRITSPGLTSPATPRGKPAAPTPKPSTASPKPSPANPTSQQVTNRGGTTLTAAEREKLTSYLQQQGIGVPPQVSNINSPTFILHDTSVILPNAALERELREGRGPLGLGVNVYVPRSSGAVVARPNFYESRRPTTTEYEKGSDILSRSERESLMRRVWSVTNSNGRSQGLNLALANLRLTPTEQKKEQASAARQLGSSGDKIYTTATWTIEKICDRYNQGDRSISINDSAMNSACDRLSGYFRTRNERVRTSVAVEILQVGARSEKGNQNTCNPRNSNIATLPSPPYSDTQYKNVLNNYLRAALMAGAYPKITTHFALDARLPESHCDPRCFNLTRLYHAISTISGHPRGTSYGITPSYGTSGGSNNLWWDNGTCHGAPEKL